MDILEALRSRRSLIVAKQGKEETGSTSVALTKSGAEFFGASIASDSKLMSFPSELVALSACKNGNDLLVEKVVTLLGAEDDGSTFLFAVKILCDYAIRVDVALAYEVYAADGSVQYSVSDIRAAFPMYRPRVAPLQDRLHVSPEKNEVTLAADADVLSMLKKYAERGSARNFPAYDSASGYGVSAILDNRTLVFGGQYGSLEGRIGMHAEMSVIADVCMRFPDQEITHLGVFSEKFADEPCMVCGNCLQFLAEVQSRFGWNMQIVCFASKSDVKKVATLDELLPFRWTSKKW